MTGELGAGLRVGVAVGISPDFVLGRASVRVFLRSRQRDCCLSQPGQPGWLASCVGDCIGGSISSLGSLGTGGLSSWKTSRTILSPTRGDGVTDLDRCLGFWSDFTGVSRIWISPESTRRATLPAWALADRRELDRCMSATCGRERYCSRVELSARACARGRLRLRSASPSTTISRDV